MTLPSIPAWRRYLRLLRPDLQADIDDEVRFHLDARIDALIAEGATPDAARAQALGEFGDIREVSHTLRDIDRRVARRRRMRDAWGDAWMDARYALRSLRRSPGLSLGILATLALGVGANAMMFSFLDTVFLRPPTGVANPVELRRVWYEIKFVDGTQYWGGFSYPQYQAILDNVGDRASTALYEPPVGTRITLGETVVTAQVSHATSTYFSLLGVRAALGRVYVADEDRLDAPRMVVVATDAFFQRVLQRDSSMLGRPIVVAGVPMTLIGVMQPGFTGTELNATDLWAPVASYPADGEPLWWTKPNQNAFATILRPRSAADGELTQRITAALSRSRIARTTGETVVRFGAINRARGPGSKTQEVQIAARLAGVALTVLLITCANVVNLLLARAVRRRREISVRLALGSSRARLIRLLLTESIVLGLAAGSIALIVAYWGGSMLRALLLPNVHWSGSPLDWRVALIAMGLSFGAGAIAGLIPALQAASPRLSESLKSGRGAGVAQRSRLRGLLVAVQSALSVVLLVGALLFVKSLSRVRGLDIGFDAAALVTARLDFDLPRPGRTRRLAPRLQAIVPSLAAIPGVEHVALASSMPMGGFSTLSFFTDHDSLGSRPGWFPTVVATMPDFFATTGVRIVRGESFSAAGPSSARTVVVNEEMANVLWPRRDPIGECLRLESRTASCYRVVGVAETSRMDKVIEDPHPQYYVSLDAPLEAPFLTPRIVLVRARPAQVASVARDVRALLAKEFPGSIPAVRRMSDALEPQYRPWRLGAALFSAFGVLALLVAAIGIYSTVSFTVVQRTHEFGVRLALGAQMPDVVRLVLGDGLRTVVVGVLFGVGLALAGGRLVAALLYGVSPSDPLTIGFVGAGLLIVAAVAALGPAWRASKVDPVSALQSD